ncbi:WecB/TagA/CpsF family glycosyltransferase [Paenibacillus provencensis]|uniref:WecB/TagA/CpsF family glycosyltransferase n=1 Tax=Paenibacillus provencensis TaxID=441151 RepID=A0ABW3PQ93_9BACL|nr:WecB/TagA/CpsF family glycosyltransferase [Paenibacillus sp. MER 78]MCM3127712.1 WecB/TagA/CpsF family glycosyltransferase [Paenibacillus sp. MER 78]
MELQSALKYGPIVNSNISALSLEESIALIEGWARNDEPNYVCICNTHSVVTASKDEKFKDVINTAGLSTPDGMPLVWALKMYGYNNQDRVDGPTLMVKLCERSADNKLNIFFYGSTEETLETLVDKMKNQYKGINICGKYSPPFRELTTEEDEQVISMINGSNADIVFVSLGCPKQEYWMFDHRDKVKGVMIGVGAAFDFYIGKVKRPPAIFQKMGMEWFFRLIHEPKRLWKRYAYNNPVYIFKFITTYRRNKRQLVSIKNMERQ